MRQPDYAILMNTDIWPGQLILDFKYKLIASIFTIDYRDDELINSTMEDMAQERGVIVKIKDYYIFLVPKYCLGDKIPNDKIRDVLKGMATFYKEYTVDRKPGRFKRYAESPELRSERYSNEEGD